MSLTYEANTKITCIKIPNKGDEAKPEEISYVKHYRLHFKTMGSMTREINNHYADIYT